MSSLEPRKFPISPPGSFLGSFGTIATQVTLQRKSSQPNYASEFNLPATLLRESPQKKRTRTARTTTMPSLLKIPTADIFSSLSIQSPKLTINSPKLFLQSARNKIQSPRFIALKHKDLSSSPQKKGIAAKRPQKGAKRPTTSSPRSRMHLSGRSSLILFRGSSPPSEEDAFNLSGSMKKSRFIQVYV